MPAAKVRKAVFPAAGLGTRFLPATKAQPKEMLPLVDKPIIQYGVEEALHSGIQNIIIVTGRGKSAIEDHFDVSFELEQLLESRNKKDLLAIVRGVSDMIDVSYIRQKEALGLGHAVLRAQELVGPEPFAVVLADDVIESETPCIRQLLDVYEFFGASVMAVMEVPPESHLVLRLHRRGTCLAQRQQGPAFSASATWWRNRKQTEAPSNLAIIGRYILTPDIFESICKRSSPAPAARSSLPMRSATCCEAGRFTVTIRRTRYDAGDKLGFLKATVEFALRRHDLGGPFREYLKSLAL